MSRLVTLLLAVMVAGSAGADEPGLVLNSSGHLVAPQCTDMYPLDELIAVGEAECWPRGGAALRIAMRLARRVAALEALLAARYLDDPVIPWQERLSLERRVAELEKLHCSAPTGCASVTGAAAGERDGD